MSKDQSFLALQQVQGTAARAQIQALRQKRAVTTVRYKETMATWEALGGEQDSWSSR